MESSYDLLGDIRRIYAGFKTEGAIKMCSLARVCQELVTILEEEQNEYIKYPDIHYLILKYLLQMGHILHNGFNVTKNDKRKVMACDILSKLTDRLI